ncbi:transposase [Salisaeta longa]|uniref:transposase n=1 Tax=Salisaeta longa TaxID=503170 RepID=UPI0012F8C6EC|nr:transposase [Salisaeta longa]
MPRDYDQYHTHHRSRRLAGWDYTRAAAYFVTLCTDHRVYLFGEVQDGRMALSAYGQIAAAGWYRSEGLRDEVHLDAFVVMPNHVHGIVVIAPPAADAPTDPHGYDLCVTADKGQNAASRSDATSVSKSDDDVTSTGRSTLPVGPPPKSLGAMMAGYKSAVTRRINKERGTPGTAVWQRNYHDHIIRTERA